MKRITLAATIGVFVATLFGALAMAQNAPLGDYARQARKQKDHQAPAAKSFDNDNLPRADKLSVVGQAPAESGDASAQRPAARLLHLAVRQKLPPRPRVVRSRLIPPQDKPQRRRRNLPRQK